MRAIDRIGLDFAKRVVARTPQCAVQQTTDLTDQYMSYPQTQFGFRPANNITFLPGYLVQLVAEDSQVYPDFKTVALPGTGSGNSTKLMGLVDAAWPGFNASIGSPNFTSGPVSGNQRGTQQVAVITNGVHPSGYLDQSGTGAATVTDGTPLVASRATAGYMQGVSTGLGGSGGAGTALLPASGIGSSLTAAALAQASQTDTLSGTPAAGDVLSVTIQTPYSKTAPGIVQTTTWTAPPLTTPQAASVTTAALALLTYLNSQPSFSVFFTATQSAGVVTITVNANSAPFLITWALTNGGLANFITLGLSGMLANSLTFSVATVTGATVSTAGSTTLASGTGYKGTIPVLVARL